jgi:dienelactone hydrolase
MARKRRRAATLIAAPLLAVASACVSDRSDEPRTPAPGSSAVTFEATDGVTLEGRVFGADGGSDLGVVLSHELPEDQTIWWDFAERLAEEGYLVLTYNFRGYCPGGEGGCSEGGKSIASIWQDTMGAIGYLRSQGASRLALIGSSMGGTASIVAAAQDEGSVQVVVTLSAPVSIEGLTVTPAMLQDITAAKLFLAGSGDSSAAADAQAFFQDASLPKRVEIVASDAHGTLLLTEGPSELVRSYIETELTRYLRPTP